MNKEESLDLLSRGCESWNDWADLMLKKKQELIEQNIWVDDNKYENQNEETRNWHSESRVDFSNFSFSSEVDFQKYKFPGFANFQNAKFEYNSKFKGSEFFGLASFDSVKFSYVADFSNCTFFDSVFFPNASFSGHAEFSEAKFLKNLYFFGVEVKSGTKFSRSEHHGSTNYSNSRFHGLVFFEETEFFADVMFNDVEFSRGVFYRETKFHGPALFNTAFFERQAFFLGVNFWNVAIFESISSKASFVLTDTKFHDVPSFVQAHFIEAPSFEYVDFGNESGRKSRMTSPGKNYEKSSPYSSRWRALKRLATQGADHSNETYFFKKELIARRLVEDKIYDPVLLFGIVYQILSDFGHSIIRPIAWWLLLWVGSAWFYLQNLGAPPEARVGFFEWIGSYVFALANNTQVAPSCVSGEGDPIWAASLLSLQNGLLSLGPGFTEKINQIYACLFGVVGGDEMHPGYVPKIPDMIVLASVFQSALSALLIFLFLLAIRNHFRIK